MYDKFPSIPVPSPSAAECWRGWDAICAEVNAAGGRKHAGHERLVIAIECYTGLHEDEVHGALVRGLAAQHFVESHDAFKTPAQIDRVVAPYLGGDDPIFGFYTPLTFQEFLEPAKLAALRQRIAQLTGIVVVYGPAALLCCEPDLIVYADMPRWEGQLRQRRDEVCNLGVDNHKLKGSLQYKRSFFVDWRVCDRLKQETLERWDYLLDTTIPGDPKLISGAAMRAALDAAVHRPFRVVPFFDPAPWGGQWLKERFELDPAQPNFGWGFDCVPEENSLLLDCAGTTVEISSLNLVFYRPRQLLGNAVYETFGPEFPIRFDFLDTVAGGNLSFQVHPLLDYARNTFGLDYTQDESYYMLDAGPGASVYLGLKPNTSPDQMIAALHEAQAGDKPFPAEQFAAQWPAKKHDHFLIPAGTVHCSGANSVVLEISATPYIFTFKLWDWGRLGLDGQPRPINIGHGKSVIQWDRDAEWARTNLINQVTPIGKGPGWREERTGLHALEFIETRRHWFTGTTPHDTQGTVNVLNLVEGEEVLVESPTGAFPPFVVHYAETFIVPAAVGPYTIRPHGPAQGKECGTIKAYVRQNAAALLKKG
jgi:mannose-6-phosphate isomerase class I